MIQYVNSQVRSIRIVRLLLTQYQDAPCCCDNLRIVCCTLYWMYYNINVYHHIKYTLMAADKTSILRGWEQVSKFHHVNAFASVLGGWNRTIAENVSKRYDRYPLNRKHSPGAPYIDLDRWRFFFAMLELFTNVPAEDFQLSLCSWLFFVGSPGFIFESSR